MLAKPQGFPRKLGGCAGLDPRLRSAVSAGVGDGERGLRRGLRAPGVGVRPKWVLEYSPSNKRIRYFVSITYVRTGLWTAHKFCGGGYIFCGEFVLCSRLRRSDIDGADGSVEELERIVGQIRQKWPRVQIVIRGDSGFCRDEILTWCEAQHRVDYVIGLAKNNRLLAAIETPMATAKKRFDRTGKPARVFKTFLYQTRDSWTRERRIIGKAEHLAKGANPRFIVTSLPKGRTSPRHIYEQTYCARGDMENRIKEQQLGLFADRTSTATMRANQLRLYLSSVAYMLMQALRRLGLQGTEFARAQCTTIRLKLLKIAAQIHVTVRRVWIRMAGGYPYATAFAQIYANLQQIPLRC